MNDDAKIEAIGFGLWCGKYSSIRGPQGQWLNYWELYEIWLTHINRNSYLKHAATMEPFQAKDVNWVTVNTSTSQNVLDMMLPSKDMDKVIGVRTS